MNAAVSHALPKERVEDLPRLRALMPELGFLLLEADGRWTAGLGPAEWNPLPDLARAASTGSPALLLAPFPECDTAPRRGSLLSCPRILRGRFSRPLPEPGELPSVQTQRDLDAPESWREGLAACIRSLGESEAEKVVLGRQRELLLREEPEAFDLVIHLARRHPGSTVFLVRLADGSLFAGASPERLLERRGLDVYSDSLAGTRDLLQQGSEEMQAASLRGSAKDQREQRIVSRSLLERFQAAGCRDCRGEEPVVRRAGPLLHLHSVIHGRLPNREAFWPLLAALHPTPALGGQPRAAALSWIARVETRARGLFGGLVGLVEAERALCCVAIRSLRLQGRRVIQFAGAGLVSDSSAATEWLETEAKLQSLGGLFGPRTKGCCA